jgi:hypothetical protein
LPELRIAFIVRLGEKRILQGAKAKLDTDFPEGQAEAPAKDNGTIGRRGKSKGLSCRSCGLRLLLGLLLASFLLAGAKAKLDTDFPEGQAEAPAKDKKRAREGKAGKEESDNDRHSSAERQSRVLQECFVVLSQYHGAGNRKGQEAREGGQGRQGGRTQEEVQAVDAIRSSGNSSPCSYPIRFSPSRTMIAIRRRSGKVESCKSASSSCRSITERDLRAPVLAAQLYIKA